MINLIIKDFKIIKKIIIFGVIYAFIIAFIGTKNVQEGILNQGFSMFYTIFMTYFSIVTANGYDEKNKANYCIRSLPISSGDIVISKYLAVAAYTIFYYSIFGIAILISNGVLSANSTAFDYKIFAVTLIISMLVFGIQYPFYFKYGAKFLQYFRTIGFLLIFIVPNILTKIIKSIDKEKVMRSIDWINNNQQLCIVILTVIAACITLVTIMCSIKVFDNKEII